MCVDTRVDATRLSELLIDLLDEHVATLEDAALPVDELAGAAAEGYGAAGVPTDDAGFVVALRAGSEFHITVIQRRR